MVVGVGMLNIGFIEYYNENRKAIGLWNLGMALFSGPGLSALIVRWPAAMRGMQWRRSASAVGLTRPRPRWSPPLRDHPLHPP